jgi:hypothetical protein
MNLYSIVLFLHIVGALGYFIALGFEWLSLVLLQRTTTVEQIREWFAVTKRMRGIAGVSLLIILVAGGYMTAEVWGGADWIEIAFAAMVVQGVIALALTTPRMRAIEKATAGASGVIPSTVTALIHHPLLWVSMLSRAGVALGIIFLMSVKTDMTLSLVVVGVSLLAGAIVGLAMGGAQRRQTVTAEITG